jgi:hypothetical protein
LPRWTSRVQIPSPAPLFAEIRVRGAVSRCYARLPKRCEKRCEGRRTVAVPRSVLADPQASDGRGLDSRPGASGGPSPRRRLPAQISPSKFVEERLVNLEGLHGANPQAGSLEHRDKLFCIDQLDGRHSVTRRFLAGVAREAPRRQNGQEAHGEGPLQAHATPHCRVVPHAPPRRCRVAASRAHAEAERALRVFRRYVELSRARSDSPRGAGHLAQVAIPPQPEGQARLERDAPAAGAVSTPSTAHRASVRHVANPTLEEPDAVIPHVRIREGPGG